MTRFLASFSYRKWTYLYTGLLLVADLFLRGSAQVRTGGFLLGYAASFFLARLWSRNHRLHYLSWRIAVVVLVGYVLVVFFAPQVVSFFVLGALIGGAGEVNLAISTQATGTKHPTGE